MLRLLVLVLSVGFGRGLQTDKLFTTTPRVAKLKLTKKNGGPKVPVGSVPA